MDTFQALAVTLVAVLPGAVYTFAVERWTGAFGVSRPDRVLRFTAASAAFVAVFAGPGYVVYRDFVKTGRLANGTVDPLQLWLVAVVYVAVPAVLGTLVGYGARENWRWAEAIVSHAREPRAWDFVWGRGRQGLVRAKLMSGSWVAGLYVTTEQGGRVSYASGYPEEAQDVYLAQQLKVDPETGAWERDENEQPVQIPGGLLLRWDQVEFVEFTELEAEG